MPSESYVNCYNETLCDVQAMFSHYCKVETVLITGDLNAQHIKRFLIITKPDVQASILICQS